MKNEEKFKLEKCPCCGYETPVEPPANEEGILDVVVCAQCGSVFSQENIGPSGTKLVLVERDLRQKRDTSIQDKIKDWLKTKSGDK